MLNVIYAPLSDVRMSEVKVGPAHGVNGPTLSQLKDHLMRFALAHGVNGPTMSQLKDHLMRFALAHGRGWEGGGKRIVKFQMPLEKTGRTNASNECQWSSSCISHQFSYGPASALHYDYLIVMTPPHGTTEMSLTH